MKEFNLKNAQPAMYIVIGAAYGFVAGAITAMWLLGW